LNSPAPRRAALVVVASGLASILTFWYFAIRTPPIPQRTLRIGFEDVPPVQIRTDNGPSGLAVETVNEAAKRAGLSLQWVETGTSSDEAFQRGLVDLWPIMADLPERRKRVHISRPWLHTSHSLLMRADSEPLGRSFTGRIAIFKIPLHVRLVGQEFPTAQLVQLPEMRLVVKELCKGTVSAGFMEDRAALTELRDKPAECASVPLRARVLPELTVELGIGSTFEAAGAADKLRAEIGNLFRDGTLASTMAKYSYYGLDNSWMSYELMETAERERWVAWGVGALGIVLALTLWQWSFLRQRKRSEAALRVSEERFRAIFQQAAVGVAQVSLDGKLTMVNDRYCEVLGYPRDELLGTELVAKAHPDDCAAMLAKGLLLLSGEIPSYSLEMRWVRKDGDVAWATLYKSAVRGSDSAPKYLVAVVEDITQRKRDEAALRESEARFRSMADTVPAMIWVAGPDKLCTFFNQGWLNFAGVTMEQALGNGWSERVHPEDRERCRRNYEAAFDARRSFQTECRLQRADGEYRWVLAVGSPRFESGGVFAGFVGSCTDTTEVKQAQEEALASQKLESLGVVSRGIAHDFNNLLGSIVTTSELVLSELPDASPASGGVESIRNVADRAAGIVRQMLSYAGQEDAAFEPLDLSRLVTEMLELLKVSISKRAQLTVDLPDSLPPILGNAGQIRQVVMNLITNASEALGEEGGVISIVLARVKAGPGPFADGTPKVIQNDHLQFSVSDTGSGMTQEIQAKIFDPFFTTKFTGRGLGLAAVQGIVRVHGGTINVTTAPGMGSQFEILLPCITQPATTTAAIPAPGSVNHAGSVDGTILVVEDEADLRISVCKMLRKAGFSVVESGDGSEGVELFRASQREFDVVLLDLTLPGMTGREVLNEVRRMRPDVNVIITTAYSHDTALESLGGQEPWLYVRKPYRIGEITALIRNACSQARHRD